MVEGYHWVESGEGYSMREWHLVRDSDTAVVREIWKGSNGVYHTDNGGGEFLDLNAAKNVCEQGLPKIKTSQRVRVVRDSDSDIVVGPHGITVKSGGSVVSVSSAGVSVSSGGAVRSGGVRPVKTKPIPEPEPPKPEEPAYSYRTTGLIQYWWAKFWRWVLRSVK
jgi:hypothetical protein